MHLRFCLYLLCALFWLTGQAHAANGIRLPDIGDSSGAVLSPEQEQRIGVEFMRRIRLQYRLVDDPEINAYIRNLGHRLAEHSDNPAQAFTFFVIDDPAINAFAAPGGYIGINTGLIMATESESELASVIGHEIAHVTQRHLARAVEASGKLNVPALAGIIAALIIGSQNSELGQATLAASQGAALQAQLDFTRSNENEADHIGIQTLAGANFDPNAMAAFFERLQHASRYYSQPPEFLSTHPVNATRIANARSRAGDYPYRQVPSSLDFHLAREKITLRAGKQANPTRYYETLLKSGQYINETATRYGYSLALANAGRYEAARQQLQPLLDKDPERINFLVADAELLLKSGKPRQALQVYRRTLRLYPQDVTVTENFANALLQLGHADEARKLLHEHRLHRVADAEFHKLLSIAEDRAGYPLEAHQSLAEYHYLNGQTGAAIQQLDSALRIKSGDFFELSKIQARRDQLKQILREESKL